MPSSASALRLFPRQRLRRDGSVGPATVTFAPGTPLLISVKIALGADLTADPLTWVWTDITSYARFSAGITTTTGRFDEAFTTTPGIARLTLNNRDGRFSRKNPMGPYYGQLTRNTPIWVTIDPGSGAYDVIQQYVNEWPPRWDGTSTDFTVPIQCGGILRRLQQGSTPLSAITRYYKALGTTPLAWWPLEDGTHATSAASGFADGYTMVALGTVTFNSSAAKGNNVFGAASYVSLANGTALYGSVLAGTSSPVAWEIISIWRTDAITAGADITVLGWSTPGGSFARYELAQSFSLASIVVTGYTLAGAATTLCSSGFIGNQTVFDEFKVSAVQSGSNVVMKLWIGGEVWATDTRAGTLARVADVTANPNFTVVNPTVNTVTNATNDLLICQVAVFDQADTTIGTQFLTTDSETGESTAPFYQWDGESARNRMVRVCAERGIPFVGTVGPTPQIGPQRALSDLDILRECEAADRGVLYEHGFGLGYQARVERYNAPVGLALNYTNGDLGGSVPEPTDDDQRLHNSWTVNRTNGSLAVSTDALSVDSEGLYAASVTINVGLDSQLRDIADWLVGVGTGDDMRWPVIGIRLDNTAGRQLIPQWVALPYGARIQVTNPPYQVTSDPIDAFVEGKTETFTALTWTASVNTTPAYPAGEVFQLDADGNRGRLDASQTLAAAVDTTATSLSVATPGSDPLLTTTAAYPTDFPVDVDVNGERMTITDVTGGSSPQTVTVIRSVNGVVKSHTTGTTVKAWKPGGLAL